MRRFSVVLGLGTILLLACGGAHVEPTRAATPAHPAPAPAPAAAPPSASDAIAAKVDPLFAAYANAERPGPGCAVGVYRAGEIVFAKGYGYASVEHEVPITPATVFEIASVAKQLTATAVLLLAADGKLSLDDDVRKHVPELPAYGRAITLRHLLAHTGGLREYDTLLDLSGYDLADVATEDEALHLVAIQRGVNFAPGSRWSYSNTGYFLLSQVVKRVSGASLGDFSRARIFEPLGMKHTVLLDDHTRVVAHRATAYARSEAGALSIAMSNREQTGEGNVETSIEDLARWDGNFYEATVGGPSWLLAMRTPGKLDDGTPVKYAMGLRVGAVGDIQLEDHAGGWAGYRADLLRYPGERLSVAVLCNDADAEPGALAEQVAGLVYPKIAASAGSPPPRPSARAAPPRTAVPDADLAAVVGTYVDRDSLRVRTLDVADGHVLIGAGPGRDAPPPGKLEVVDARTFRAPGSSTVYRFEPATRAGAPARLVRTAPGDPPRTYERQASVTLDAAALGQLAGRYRSDETTRDMRIAVAGNGLQRGPWGKKLVDAALTPVARDVFTEGDALAIRFERDARGKVARAVMSIDGYASVRWTKVADTRP
jgi:CubicO group peptidase (beta-lactamase class C family)